MRKHKKLMVTSGILLVLILITACFVGGTFAKYVTEGEGQDNARVAKWGVTVDVIGDGFKTSYEKDDISSGIEEDTVVSSTEAKVVAPGTGGTFGGVKISGTPEVAVEVNTEAVVTLSGWNVADGEFYCPLVFNIGDQKINGLDYSKATNGGEDSFESAIRDAIQNATTMELEAGSDLSEVGNSITYSWKWPFENAEGKVSKQSDALDTIWSGWPVWKTRRFWAIP